MTEPMKVDERAPETPELDVDASEPAGDADLAQCALCGARVERVTTYQVNDQTACVDCVSKVYRELAAQQPRGMPVVVAGACGLLGALLGAVVWAAVGVATNMEVGYVAVLVGFLAGLGVKLGAGVQRGAVLQYVAAGMAVIGLVAAKYMFFAFTVVSLGHDQGLEIGYFDSRLIAAFPEALGEMVGVFDVLFVFLAIGAAYRVPKPASVSIVKV